MLVNYCLPCKTVIALASFGNSQSAARLLNLHFKLNFPPNDVSNVCVFVFVNHHKEGIREQGIYDVALCVCVCLF